MRSRNMTNMCELDQLMRDFITQTKPIYGPQAVPINYPPQFIDPINFPQPPAEWTICGEDERSVPPFWSHGADLAMQGNEVDDAEGRKLIETLLRCLADRPADRPTLHELMRIVQWVEMQEGYRDPDDFFERLLRVPEAVSRGLLQPNMIT